MSYKTLTIPPFDKQLKRLVKKYPSLKAEFANLIESLEINPFHGVALIRNCYKIRIAIKSKGKGKRGGARIITHIVVSDKEVFLIAIYDKSEKATLTDSELNELLSTID